MGRDITMSPEDLDALIALMMSYYNLYIAQLYDHSRPSKIRFKEGSPVAPKYFMTITNYLSSEYGYYFDPLVSRFHHFPSEMNIHIIVAARFLQKALQRLCENFWQLFRQKYWLEIHPPAYFVDVLDYLERRFLVLFSYQRGTFIDT